MGNGRAVLPVGILPVGKDGEQDKGKGKAKAKADVKGKGKARVEFAESVAAAAPSDSSLAAEDGSSVSFRHNRPNFAPKNSPDNFAGFGRTPVRRGGPSFL